MRPRLQGDGLALGKLLGLVGVEPAQLGDTQRAGGNQEQVSTHPGSGGSEAGSGIAEGRYQHHPHPGTGGHLQHPGQDGKGAEAHPLDGEPDDIHQRQGEEEGGLNENIPGSELGEQGGVQLPGVQEELGELGGKVEHGAEGDYRVAQPKQRTGPDPLAQPIQLTRAHILPAVGGHGGPHGVKGAGQQLIHLAPGRHGGHIETTQGVHRGLEHDGADGSNRILQAHGNAHGAQHPAGVEVQSPLLLCHAQDGVFLHHIEQTRHAGYPLRSHRGDGRPGHSGLEAQNQGEVQQDVQYGGQGQEVDRRFAVPQGADHSGQQVIQEGGGDAHEDDENIGIGVVEDVRRGEHRRQDLPAQQAGGRGEHHRENHRQPGGVGHIAAHFRGLPRPHPLGHRDSEAVAHPHTEADHKEVDGAGGAHRRQGRGAQQLAHDHGVHHVVELLEQHPEQGGQGKADNQPHGAAGGQVSGHNRLPSF